MNSTENTDEVFEHYFNEVEKVEVEEEMEKTFNRKKVPFSSRRGGKTRIIIKHDDFEKNDENESEDDFENENFNYNLDNLDNLDDIMKFVNNTLSKTAIASFLNLSKSLTYQQLQFETLYNSSR